MEDVAAGQLTDNGLAVFILLQAYVAVRLVVCGDGVGSAGYTGSAGPRGRHEIGHGAVVGPGAAGRTQRPGGGDGRGSDQVGLEAVGEEREGLNVTRGYGHSLDAHGFQVDLAADDPASEGGAALALDEVHGDGHAGDNEEEGAGDNQDPSPHGR